MKLFFPGLLIALALLVSPAVVAANAGEIAPGPSIGLALGSGGAGGLAHIAMLQVFDDLAVNPDRIAGTSIGAVIGALYAAGLSAAEIHAIFDAFSGSSLEALSRLTRSDSELTTAQVFSLDLNNGGLIDSGGFLSFLAGKIEARTFNDLVIPLEVVATDYWTGEMVVLDEGDLFAAVEASMAVPGLFSPVPRGEQLLIDGGTSNPLPFDLLNNRYDLIVAIDVTGSRMTAEENRADLTDLLFSTFTIMQQSIISAQIRTQQPDIYIKPDISGIRMLHFNRINTIIEQSRPAAEALKQQLSDALGDVREK